MTIIVCGSSWGLGVTVFGKNARESCYGFPCTNNPHRFFPDYECATEKEIENWEEAKAFWFDDNEMSILKEMNT